MPSTSPTIKVLDYASVVYRIFVHLYLKSDFFTLLNIGDGLEPTKSSGVNILHQSLLCLFSFSIFRGSARVGRARRRRFVQQQPFCP